MILAEYICGLGDQDGVFHVENPRIRAFSIIFAVFGIAESLEGEETMRLEVEEVIKRMLK